jgi:hypothetical protein
MMPSLEGHPTMRFKHAFFCAWLRFTAGKSLREYQGNSQPTLTHQKISKGFTRASDERIDSFNAQAKNIQNTCQHKFSY